MPPVLGSETRRDGRLLASRHALGPSTVRHASIQARLRRLDHEFERFFEESRTRAAAELSPHLSPRAREWLLDNDFIVAEALEGLRDALPARFLSRLPGLRAPEDVAGSPRIEAIARSLVRRGRGRVEVDEIELLVGGYQEVHSLRLAELWALPSFLRILLLEELLALATGRRTAGEVGPYILSLRTLAGEDWRGVVEALSGVERILREDPAGVYPLMDFRSRDRYRSQVELIARHGGNAEEMVAKAAIELARSQAARPREGHVGYYLVDEGKEHLLDALGTWELRSTIPRTRRRRAGWAYFGGIGALTISLLTMVWWVTSPGWIGAPLLLLSAIPALGTAVALANWTSGQLASPRPLPRLDVRDGIPPGFRTFVAVPVLLGSPREVPGLLHTLETNYQANPDPELTFALLSDFRDAEAEFAPDDTEVLATAAAGIRGLNERYGGTGEGPFLLLHRPRRWNEAEGCWMGWERKRGKLAQLNQLLLRQPSELSVVEGDPDRIRDVPFVLTLDADTRLPRNAAARLVGTLAHPLNRPEVDQEGRVTRGYSVLQPRVEILPDPDGGTLFSRVVGGIQGLDLYARAAFDVYQDLFDVGIFGGKGIYDVAAFEGSLAGYTPENALLSHDLFEGAHGRAGLVSDLILLEDFPGHPLANARRAHRWTRGDWQILPWLRSRVPGPGGVRIPSRISTLSRWMIFDNLRRSLQPLAILVLLIVGWLLRPEMATAWTVVLAAVIGLPFLTGTADAALRILRDPPKRGDLESETRGLLRALGRWALELALLPFEAVNASDAIGRTLSRMYFTRRGLLEWTSAAHTAKAVRRSHSGLFMIRQMLSGPAVAVGVAGGLFLANAQFPGLPGGVLALWLVSPAIGVWVSRPRRPVRDPRGRFPRAKARSLARRTWGYYERFQGPDSHWLAPDHFQEHPGAEVAHRTSPTNVGMALVAGVTAWDLGFSTTTRFLTRTRNTMEAMDRLTRYRGHFLNWYDTSSLEPLHPLFVSTVDSGNLAACFLVVRGAISEALVHPVWGPNRIDGLGDTLTVLSEVLSGVGDGNAEAVLADVETLRKWASRSLPSAWARGMGEYVTELEEMRDVELPKLEEQLARVQEGPDYSGDGGWTGVGAWLNRLRWDVEETIDEVVLLAPWLSERFRGTERSARVLEQLFGDGRSGPSLREFEHHVAREISTSDPSSETHASDREWREGLERALATTRLLIEDSERLVDRLDQLYEEMDFSFLYDRRRQLFRIGFSVSQGELDRNHYDLLASEARIASIVALSKRDAPPAHWLHLGRPFTWTDRGPALLSWAGTMFEYLMPALFLRMPPDTILEEGCRRAVEVQRDHGRREHLPWGHSESGYYMLSPEGHYQYRAFGVPELGLRRSTESRRVVAPYASLMAVSLAPGAAFANFEALSRLGGIGTWGPYEALDFGPRTGGSHDPRIVRSYMSHHHGMIVAALGNYLTDNRLVERFHADPRINTVEPYLYERIPWRRALEREWVDRQAVVVTERMGPGIRTWSPPVDRIPPPVHQLAGHHLVVSIGVDGRGGSRWRDWSIVRGGVGTGMPAGGPDLVLMDRSSGASWRPLPHPEADPADDQEVIFAPHRAELVRKNKGIRTRMDLLVPADASVEVREISIANEEGRPRHLRVALGVELALAPWRDDLRHPAFHRLFVRAEVLPAGEGVIFERRRRSPDERPPVLFVSLLGTASAPVKATWGTARGAFLGRSRNRRRPAALDEPGLIVVPPGAHHPLDPMACTVLDLDLEPWETRSFTLLLSVGEDRDSALRGAAEFRSPQSREWARIQTRAAAETELAGLGATADDPRVWSEILSFVLGPPGGPDRRREAATGIDLRQSVLWKWGVSGDLPFLLIEGDVERESGVLSEALRARLWWKRRGQEIEIVVVGTPATGYHDPVRERIRDILEKLGCEESLGRPGGVHVVPPARLHDGDHRSLRALAALRFDAAGPSLAAQVPPRHLLPQRVSAGSAPVVETTYVASPRAEKAGPPSLGGNDLVATSAFGGFDPATGEYVIDLEGGDTTPAPWVNVVSRDELGFVVTEAGGSFTWAEDAGEFRLTPWSNDPVLGLTGEILYLRDEEDRSVWTPAPGPLGRTRRHRVRHGWGHTSLEASADGLDETVSWFLHPDLPVKVVQVGLANRGDRPRRISATYFVDWVLGPHPASTRGRLDVHFSPTHAGVLARNPFSLAFGDRMVFLTTDGAPDAMATDRSEFLGASGPLDRIPVGLREMVPGERPVPEGLPCGVIQRVVTIGPGEEEELAFFLGAVPSGDTLDEVLRQLRGHGRTRSLQARVRTGWDDYLGAVRVRTPEPALDSVVNGWLPYQTLASRLRGRTGYYQSSGAFGFRDQLQDVYALLPLDPHLAAAHLEEAARRQFQEGDVLHWWHPDTTTGVRTRCSDDLLWLPWVLAQTVRWTGDLDLLDAEVPFLEGAPLAPDEDERYAGYEPSIHSRSLLEHALRAVERSAGHLSPRGLPLIGAGDWNDGMDRVGREGRGESVWLGWFFVDVCRLLAPLARARGEDGRALAIEEWSDRVRSAIEAYAWDGEWYRRAFFDDGTPLGSRDATEARIDSIAQSWAVISEAGDPERARQALDSAWKLLVREEMGIALLLTPPFSGDGMDPGYIAAYPPGVRENGGQYTHAATWLLRALAKSGQANRAGRLLRILLPAGHAEGPDTDRYMVEPYVATADIYGEPPHAGRGGWSWYTGSAGWMWRVVLEDVLGVDREGDHLIVDPCIPSEWPAYRIDLSVDGTRIEIDVRNPEGVSGGVRSCRMNGKDVDPMAIPWRSGADGGGIRIEVVLGR